MLGLKHTGVGSDRVGSNPGCRPWAVCGALSGLHLPDLKVGSRPLPNKAVLWTYNETQHMRAALHIVGAQHRLGRGHGAERGPHRAPRPPPRPELVPPPGPGCLVNVCIHQVVGCRDHVKCAFHPRCVASPPTTSWTSICLVCFWAQGVSLCLSFSQTARV